MASLTTTMTPPAYSQQIAPAASPSKAAKRPNSVAPYPGHGYNPSFDNTQRQSLSQPLPSNYTQSFSNGPVSNPSFSRSFGGPAQLESQAFGEPQIYTAVYSGVSVYEMAVGAVACMRRRDDGWLNATQILKVAGVEKGKRTKVLEKEILTGEHEKVQGGYGKYQGTWISYKRGREFCRQYGVEDLLRPLLDYDVSADGTSGQGQDTPTKEQAMAANRKRFYNGNLDPRPAGSSAANGTFFSNISPNTSVALAAMNKAASLNTPVPRPNSAQRASNFRRPSQQETYNGASQQSIVSDVDKPDSGYSTQPVSEPPRKRMRRESHEGMAPPSLPMDTSMQSVSPTEPNGSFIYDAALMQDSVNSAGEPIALQPLPSPRTDDQQDKMNLILDLFAEQSKADYSSHPAFTQLSGEDLNMPLDASANNALHWAATLAKIPLLRLLVQKGASIWRGNAAGQSPLISAVLVNNCWEHACFTDLLDVLSPLIEVRDLQGRTILHHIAVSSGIKGRAQSSKYYLEALLEFLVRIGTLSNPHTAGQGTASIAMSAANMHFASQQTIADVSSQDNSMAGLTQQKGPVTLARFFSHVVNARDKAGNTALNLVARIGNRSIIQQLLEIHADPNLPNNKGVSAKDFGVAAESNNSSQINGGRIIQQPGRSGVVDPGLQPNVVGNSDATVGASGSQVEDLSQDIVASLTTMLTENLSTYKETLRVKSLEIDRLNEEIREISSIQKTDTEAVQEMKERVRIRAEKQAQVANLRREVERRKREVKNASSRRSPKQDQVVQPEWLSEATLQQLSSSVSDDQPPDEVQRDLLDKVIPAPSILRAGLNALTANNIALNQQADQLRGRSSELAAMYRKVVSICTGVAEDKIEESLPALVAAVESERGGLGEQEVGRVREFLRRVDGSRDQTLAVNPTITAIAAAAAAAASMVNR